MTFKSSLRTAVFGLSLFVIAACDNAEQRAEGHYKKGLELVEAGQLDKAALEFRNAIKLDQEAFEPRLEFAKILMLQGDLNGAAENFQRVIELEPNNRDARASLGRIYLVAGQLEQAQTHVDAVYGQYPDDIEVQGLKATLDLRMDKPGPAGDLARSILETNPGDGTAALVIATIALDNDDHEGAVAALDRALEDAPRDLGLHVTKLRAVELSGNHLAVGDQLKDMYNIAPQNDRVVQSLVQWHVTNGDIGGGEDVLRERASRFPDNLDYLMAVVGYRDRFIGIGAARDELAALVLDHPDAPIFQRALAELDVREGRAAEAVTRLEELLSRDLGTNEKIATQVQLAQTLIAQQRYTESGALVEQILAADATNVDALVIRARLAINEDRPEAAINDLRTALDASPQNPTILTLLAQAHERNGSKGLAQERLALAVRASSNGVEESLRYAEFLARDDKFGVAESVLEDALERRPNSPTLLGGYARLLLQQSKWPEAERVLARLEAIKGSEQADRIADEIRVAILSGQQRFDESIGVLRDMWNEAGEKTSAMENLVRTYLQTGKADEAITFLQEEILSTEPKNLRANLLLGAVHAFKGDTDAAEAQYRKAIADHPDRENGYGALVRLLARTDRKDEAREVMQQGLDTAQDATGLWFARALELERAGDYDAAIKVYERLYDQNKISDVLANNYASLLSEHRDDQESLDRAFAVAKRLRSATNPAFQDTYGWILYKRGEYERALQPLKSAAEGIPNNALVQYHLGMLYRELGKKEDAVTQLQKAVELSEGKNLPQLEGIEELILELQGG